MDIREVRRRNLKALMDREFGVNARGAQTRLAEKLEKPQNFISRCLADPDRAGSKTIGEDFAREIEEKFGLARYALDLPIGEIGPESNVQSAPQPERYYRYPVLTRVAAGAFACAVQPYAPGAEDEWEYSDYKAAGPAFWFEVTGHSMTSPTPPSFPPGVLVLIDTGLEPLPGDYVLATIPDEEEATFKQLIREDGQLYLKPLNSDYRTMPVAEGCRLIGKAKEAKFKL